MIDGILRDTGATEYKLYLTKASDPLAFRKLLYPAYKAHRKQPKPKHYKAIREYLVKEWDAEIVGVIEADDALGIHQDETSIICSIDKDLLQIEGRHYNFVKGEFSTITKEQGLMNFYTQMITGDTADNIKGIKGMGPVAAKKLLGKYELEQDLFDITREAYDNDELFLMNGRLLWIYHKEDDDWINHFERLKFMDYKY